VVPPAPINVLRWEREPLIGPCAHTLRRCAAVHGSSASIARAGSLRDRRGRRALDCPPFDSASGTSPSGRGHRRRTPAKSRPPPSCSCSEIAIGVSSAARAT